MSFIEKAVCDEEYANSKNLYTRLKMIDLSDLNSFTMGKK